MVLVKYFNELFKATNYTYSFCYGDIILPGKIISNILMHTLFNNAVAPTDSKKFNQIIKFMLNYYLFFEMVEMEVVGAADEKIEIYNKFLSKKNQLQHKHEEIKIQSEKVSKIFHTKFFPFISK